MGISLLDDSALPVTGSRAAYSSRAAAIKECRSPARTLLDVAVIASGRFLGGSTMGDARSLWSRILVGVGGLAMLVGAVDPLEGSVVILAGSGLVTLGTWLGGSDRRLVVDWLSIFGLVLLGVVALFALSAVGGIGGRSGRSLWWGVLILPYPAAWVLGMANLVQRLIGRIRARHAA
jgi:hypothetical protein